MKAVVLFSGGLDSTVLASHLISKGAEVRLLSIDYGQRHAKELARVEVEPVQRLEAVDQPQRFGRRALERCHPHDEVPSGTHTSRRLLASQRPVLQERLPQYVFKRGEAARSGASTDSR